jgi:hypothetical protein
MHPAPPRPVKRKRKEKKKVQQASPPPGYSALFLPAPRWARRQQVLR